MFWMDSTRNYIKNDFILISEPLSKAELINIVQTSTDKKIFCQEYADIYHVHFLENSNHIDYQLCEIIDETSDLEDIVAVAFRQLYIIVRRDSQIVGYITTHGLSQYLYEKYRRLHAFIDTILETTDESFTVVDEDKTVVAWTKGAEKLFSVKQKDIIGKPITDFFKDHHLEVLNTLKGSSVHHKQHMARDNQVVLINSNPVYLDDEIIGAVVSESDITNQISLYNELFNTTEKLFNLEKEVTKLTANEDPFQPIRGSSPLLNETIDKVKKAAMTEASILIQGESGVGKELFAKAAHSLREDSDAPFIAINCGAIPDALFESEMFGYVRGAFSGANQKGKQGKVELAKNGTLFLDEIGEMPLDMQVKLLRLLQEKKFYPVGGTQEIEVEFRVIAATNKDLNELVADNKFRDDLFYRLNVVSIDIPPLRKRPADIIELTHYFLNDISIKYNRPIHGMSQPVMQALLQHDWPGNIRELQNVVERLVVFSDNGTIKIEDLPFEINTEKAPHSDATKTNYDYNDQRPLNDRLLDVERNILKQELEHTNGNKLQCAENLNITRATLYNRLKKVGLD